MFFFCISLIYKKINFDEIIRISSNNLNTILNLTD